MKMKNIQPIHFTFHSPLFLFVTIQTVKQINQDLDVHILSDIKTKKLINCDIFFVFSNTPNLVHAEE